MSHTVFRPNLLEDLQCLLVVVASQHMVLERGVDIADTVEVVGDPQLAAELPFDLEGFKVVAQGLLVLTDRFIADAEIVGRCSDPFRVVQLTESFERPFDGIDSRPQPAQTRQTHTLIAEALGDFLFVPQASKKGLRFLHLGHHTCVPA